jgi:hypothetical protein
MESQIPIAVATAVVPLAAVASLLWVSRRLEQRRAAGIARQIALTDALHREIGAAAAPVVRRSRLRGWTVSVAVPLEREDTVGAVVRIAHQLFSRLDRVEAPRLRIVLTPREPAVYAGSPASRALASQSRRAAPSSWAAADGSRGRHLSK